MALLSLVHANIRGVLVQRGREEEGKKREKKRKRRGRKGGKKKGGDIVPDSCLYAVVPVVCTQLYQLSVRSCTSCLYAVVYKQYIPVDNTATGHVLNI